LRWTCGLWGSFCESIAVSWRSIKPTFSYTLLIGKPPFQTKDVKAIYKRIRENRYEFPADKEISTSARHLIMTILNTNPGTLKSCPASTG
jgi:hypothetical protein